MRSEIGLVLLKEILTALSFYRKSLTTIWASDCSTRVGKYCSSGCNSIGSNLKMIMMIQMDDYRKPEYEKEKKRERGAESSVPRRNRERNC